MITLSVLVASGGPSFLRFFYANVFAIGVFCLAWGIVMIVADMRRILSRAADDQEVPGDLVQAMGLTAGEPPESWLLRIVRGLRRAYSGGGGSTMSMRIYATLLVSLWALAALPDVGADGSPGVDSSIVRITETSAQQFADGFFADAREAYPYVGASVAIVHNGALVYAGDYGRYGIDDDRPVDAERTLFGAGSIGKLVTWTSVMQLAERGYVDLDTDVNTYLTSFAIPAAFDEPITLRHLLTHTPGFDDTTIGSVTTDIASLTGLETYLATHVPARVRPPGRVTQYSNYGAALAGFIVGEASGKDFHAYVEAEIFASLGMDRSSFRQPLPPDLAQDATAGHVVTPTGTIRAVPHVYGEIYPAGTGFFTATDLARFMIAHLQAGGPMLRPETAQTMHARAFANDPRLPGMALGFIEGETNGIRTLWHTGTSPAGSHGLLVLVPSTGTGLVMLTNTVNPRLTSALRSAFFDDFFPGGVAVAAEPARSGSAAVTGLPSPAGRYRQNWYARRGIEKIDSLNLESHVAETGDGTIRARFEDGVPRDYVAIAPDLYQEVDRGELLSVERDAGGRVVRLYRGERPIVAYERLGVHETQAFNLILVNLSLTLLGAFAMRPIVGAVVGRITGRERLSWTGLDRVARSLGVATGWIGIAFFAGYAAILVLAGTTSILRSPLAVLVFNLPAVLIVLALVLAVAAFAAWNGRASLASRIHLTLLSPAALALAWFAWQWNVLGYMG